MKLNVAKLKGKVFIDGKNAFDKKNIEKEKIIYRGIGT
jgi:hypothetical protein